MKKKAFLKSIAALATSVALDASAALPESVTDHLAVPVAMETTASNSTTAKTTEDPFVLERSQESTSVADHYSHRSHASHRSHYSSR